MTMPTELPLKAYMCSGCGWLNRGFPNGFPPSKHQQMDKGERSWIDCPGEWLEVVVAPYLINLTQTPLGGFVPASQPGDDE